MKIELPQSEASEVPKVISNLIGIDYQITNGVEATRNVVNKSNKTYIPLIEPKIYVIIVFITSLHHITPSSCQINERVT